MCGLYVVSEHTYRDIFTFPRLICCMRVHIDFALSQYVCNYIKGVFGCGIQEGQERRFALYLLRAAFFLSSLFNISESVE